MPEHNARAAGTIYDLGYQHYEGRRLGRANAVRTLFVYSLKTAFGLGRGERAKLVPVAILLFCFMPAVVRVGVAMSTGEAMFINYAQHLEMSAFFLALFTAAQAPELIVSDRQHGTLSLYLSRPLRATDYALAKYLALVAALLALTLGPQLFLYAGKIAIGENLFEAMRGERSKLLPIFGGSLGASAMFAAIGLALSSFASKRNYANAAVIGFFLITTSVVAIFHGIAQGDVKRYLVLAHPVWVMNGFVNWLFDIEARGRTPVGRAELPGEYFLYVILVGCAVALALLLARYRNRDA